MAELTASQKRLAALADAQKIGDKMADAFAKSFEIKVSKAWEGMLPPLSTVSRQPTSVPGPQEPPRAAPKSTEQAQTAPEPSYKPQTPQRDAWTPQWMPKLDPVGASPMPQGFSIQPSGGFHQVPVPQLREREGNGVSGFSSVPGVPPQTGGSVNTPAAKSFSGNRMEAASDVFRQVSAANSPPAPGISFTSGKRDDMPGWAKELTDAIKELTSQMGEADEDETEHGENAPKRNTESRPIQATRYDRELPSIASAAPRPTRVQPPMPSGGR